MTTWQVQTAKQRFSEVVRAAQTGEAQFITRHGEPVAVIIDIADYRRTHEPEERMPLNEYLLTIPKIEDFELPPRELEPEPTRVDELVQSWLEDEV